MNFHTILAGFLVLTISVALIRMPNDLWTPEENVATFLHLNNSNLARLYCSVSSEDVDQGSQFVLATLNQITSKPYFRYYRTNTEKECPYWAVSMLCMSSENTCSVCKCDANSIPERLLVSGDMSDLAIPDAHISQFEPFPSNADEWGVWINEESSAEYVDLTVNPEGNTGYVGPMAGKVWSSIYKENCLKEGSSQYGECQEVELLHTLVSGLHSSINVHVCTNYYRDPDLKSSQHKSGIYNNPNVSFFPNCEMYRNRVAALPVFVENLYVLYLFVLRALAKAKPLFMKDLNFYNSGLDGVATVEDIQLHESMRAFFNSAPLNRNSFDESVFMSSPKAHLVIPDMMKAIHNITLLMDCVTCEKCRVWGKLQVKGIATAVKVVLNWDEVLVDLDRGERVSLINLARQLAFSVRNVQRLGGVCMNDGDDRPV